MVEIGHRHHRGLLYTSEYVIEGVRDRTHQVRLAHDEGSLVVASECELCQGSESATYLPRGEVGNVTVNTRLKSTFGIRCGRQARLSGKAFR
mgnify:CR=1 FL=1